MVRGVTQDIGPADDHPRRARLARGWSLAQRVIMAEREPGEHRAIVDLRTLDVLRWIDEPPPGIAWENNGAAPARASTGHDLRRPADVAAAGDEDRVEGSLRVRAVSGDWTAVSVTASLMLLDQHTTAAPSHGLAPELRGPAR